MGRRVLQLKLKQRWNEVHRPETTNVYFLFLDFILCIFTCLEGLQFDFWSYFLTISLVLMRVPKIKGINTIGSTSEVLPVPTSILYA